MNKFTWEEFEGLEGFHYAYYDKVELGFIEFWKPWKKWVWNQNENVVMSLDCMEEVCKKLNDTNNIKNAPNQSQGERASGNASESMSNKRDISNPDTNIKDGIKDIKSEEVKE